MSPASHTRSSRLAAALLAVLCACVAVWIGAPSARAAQTCVQIVDGFSTNVPTQGTDFAVREADVDVGAGSVTLANDCAGTGPINVNDGIQFDVRKPDGTTSSFSHDFSNGCSGTITSAGPFDVGSQFAPGVNHVTVHLQDLCGQAGSSADDEFLVFNEAPKCVEDVHVGQVVAHGCFKERSPGVFETDQPAWVGGIPLVPRSGGKLVVVPGTNHYTVLLGQHPKVKSALRTFLGGK